MQKVKVREVIIEGSDDEGNDFKGLKHAKVVRPASNPEEAPSKSESYVGPELSLAIASGADGKSNDPTFYCYEHKLKPGQNSITQETKIVGVAKGDTSLMLQVAENDAHLVSAKVFVSRGGKTAFYKSIPKPFDTADAIQNESKANGTPVTRTENTFNGVTVDLSGTPIIAGDKFAIVLIFTTLLRSPHENQVIVMRNGGSLGDVTPRLVIESGEDMRQVQNYREAKRHIEKTLQDIQTRTVGNMDGLPGFIQKDAGATDHKTDNQIVNLSDRSNYIVSFDNFGITQRHEYEAECLRISDRFSIWKTTLDYLSMRSEDQKPHVITVMEETEVYIRQQIEGIHTILNDEDGIDCSPGIIMVDKIKSVRFSGDSTTQHKSNKYTTLLQRSINKAKEKIKEKGNNVIIIQFFMTGHPKDRKEFIKMMQEFIKDEKLNRVMFQFVNLKDDTHAHSTQQLIREIVLNNNRCSHLDMTPRADEETTRVWVTSTMLPSIQSIARSASESKLQMLEGQNDKITILTKKLQYGQVVILAQDNVTPVLRLSDRTQTENESVIEHANGLIKRIEHKTNAQKFNPDDPAQATTYRKLIDIEGLIDGIEKQDVKRSLILKLSSLGYHLKLFMQLVSTYDKRLTDNTYPHETPAIYRQRTPSHRKFLAEQMCNREHTLDSIQQPIPSQTTIDSQANDVFFKKEDDLHTPIYRSLGVFPAGYGAFITNPQQYPRLQQRFYTRNSGPPSLNQYTTQAGKLSMTIEISMDYFYGLLKAYSKLDTDVQESIDDGELTNELEYKKRKKKVEDNIKSFIGYYYILEPGHHCLEETELWQKIVDNIHMFHVYFQEALDDCSEEKKNEWDLGFRLILTNTIDIVNNKHQSDEYADSCDLADEMNKYDLTPDHPPEAKTPPKPVDLSTASKRKRRQEPEPQQRTEKKAALDMTKLRDDINKITADFSHLLSVTPTGDDQAPNADEIRNMLLSSLTQMGNRLEEVTKKQKIEGMLSIKELIASTLGKIMLQISSPSRNDEHKHESTDPSSRGAHSDPARCFGATVGRSDGASSGHIQSGSYFEPDTRINTGVFGSAQ